MKDLDEGVYWLVGLTVIVAGACGIFLVARVTPDPSIECVKAGGSWRTENNGHCERVAK